MTDAINNKPVSVSVESRTSSEITLPDLVSQEDYPEFRDSGWSALMGRYYVEIKNLDEYARYLGKSSVELLEADIAKLSAGNRAAVQRGSTIFLPRKDVTVGLGDAAKWDEGILVSVVAVDSLTEIFESDEEEFVYDGNKNEMFRKGDPETKKRQEGGYEYVEPVKDDYGRAKYKRIGKTDKIATYSPTSIHLTFVNYTVKSDAEISWSVDGASPSSVSPVLNADSVGEKVMPKLVEYLNKPDHAKHAAGPRLRGWIARKMSGYFSLREAIQKQDSTSPIEVDLKGILTHIPGDPAKNFGDYMVEIARRGWLKSAMDVNFDEAKVTFANKADALAVLKLIYVGSEKNPLRYHDTATQSLDLYMGINPTAASGEGEPYAQGAWARSVYEMLRGGGTGVEESPYAIDGLEWSKFDVDEPQNLYQRYLLGVRTGSAKVEIVRAEDKNGQSVSFVVNVNSGDQDVAYPDGWSAPTPEQMKMFRLSTPGSVSVRRMNDTGQVYEEVPVYFETNSAENYELLQSSSQKDGFATTLKIWIIDQPTTKKVQAYTEGYVEFERLMTHEQALEFLSFSGLSLAASSSMRAESGDEERSIDENGNIVRTYIWKSDCSVLFDAADNIAGAIQPFYGDIFEFDDSSGPASKYKSLKEWPVQTFIDYYTEHETHLQERLKNATLQAFDGKNYSVAQLVLYYFQTIAMAEGLQDQTERLQNLIVEAEDSIGWQKKATAWGIASGVLLQLPFIGLIFYQGRQQLKIARETMDMMRQQMKLMEKQIKMMDGTMSEEDKVKMLDEIMPDRLKEMEQKYTDTGNVDFFVLGRRSEIQTIFDTVDGMVWGRGDSTGRAIMGPGGTGKDFLMWSVLTSKVTGYWPLNPEEYDRAFEAGDIKKYLRKEMTYKQLVEKWGTPLPEKYKRKPHEQWRELDPRNMMAGTGIQGTEEARWKVVLEMFRTTKYHLDEAVVFTNEMADMMAVGRNGMTGAVGVIENMKIPVASGYIRHLGMFADIDQERIYNKPNGQRDEQMERRWAVIEFMGQKGLGDQSVEEVRIVLQTQLLEKSIKGNFELPPTAELQEFCRRIARDSIKYYPTMGNPSRSIMILKTYLGMMKQKEIQDIIRSVAGSGSPINVDALDEVMRLRPDVAAEVLIVNIKESLQEIISSQGYDMLKLKEEAKFLLESWYGSDIPAEIPSLDEIDRFFSKKDSPLLKSVLSTESNQQHLNSLASLLSFLDQKKKTLYRGANKEGKPILAPLTPENQALLVRQIITILLYNRKAVDPSGQGLVVDPTTLLPVESLAPKEGPAKILYDRMHRLFKDHGLDYDKMAQVYSLGDGATINSTELRNFGEHLLSKAGSLETESNHSDRLQVFESEFLKPFEEGTFSGWSAMSPEWQQTAITQAFVEQANRQQSMLEASEIDAAAAGREQEAEAARRPLMDGPTIVRMFDQKYEELRSTLNNILDGFDVPERQKQEKVSEWLGRFEGIKEKTPESLKNLLQILSDMKQAAEAKNDIFSENPTHQWAKDFRQHHPGMTSALRRVGVLGAPGRWLGRAMFGSLHGEEKAHALAGLQELQSGLVRQVDLYIEAVNRSQARSSVAVQPQSAPPPAVAPASSSSPSATSPSPVSPSPAPDPARSDYERLTGRTDDAGFTRWGELELKGIKDAETKAAILKIESLAITDRNRSFVEPLKTTVQSLIENYLTLDADAQRMIDHNLKGVVSADTSRKLSFARVLKNILHGLRVDERGSADASVVHWFSGDNGATRDVTFLRALKLLAQGSSPQDAFHTLLNEKFPLSHVLDTLMQERSFSEYFDGILRKYFPEAVRAKIKSFAQGGVQHLGGFAVPLLGALLADLGLTLVETTTGITFTPEEHEMVSLAALAESGHLYGQRVGASVAARQAERAALARGAYPETARLSGAAARSGAMHVATRSASYIAFVRVFPAFDLGSLAFEKACEKLGFHPDTFAEGLASFVGHLGSGMVLAKLFEKAIVFADKALGTTAAVAGEAGAVARAANIIGFLYLGIKVSLMMGKINARQRAAQQITWMKRDGQNVVNALNAKLKVDGKEPDFDYTTLHGILSTIGVDAGVFNGTSEINDEPLVGHAIMDLVGGIVRDYYRAKKKLREGKMNSDQFDGTVSELGLRLSVAVHGGFNADGSITRLPNEGARVAAVTLVDILLPGIMPENVKSYLDRDESQILRELILGMDPETQKILDGDAIAQEE